MKTNIHKLNGFIYVTSDEEIIKPMDWIIGVVGTLMCVSTKAFQTYEKLSIKPNWSKIILTNDKTLTNVQQLTPEEEAYCKTVDSVEVDFSHKNKHGFFEKKASYKLQLPKQETIEEVADEYSSQALWKCGESWKDGYNHAVKTHYTADDMINFANLFSVVEVNNEHLEFFNQNK